MINPNKNTKKRHILGKIVEKNPLKIRRKELRFMESSVSPKFYYNL